VLIGTNKLVTVGRGFVTLNQRAPTSVGIEFTSEALRALPQPINGFRDIYGINLPAEAVYSPFTYAAVYYWGGHPPVGVGDVPHFHVHFGISPPEQPIAADPFQVYKAPAPAELPPGYVPVNGPDGLDVALGIEYQDPAQPAAQVGWNSTGQDYYFYLGHMNDIDVGATKDFLFRQEAGQQAAATGIIKQPQVYPKPGYYPNRYTVKYDASRSVIIFTLEDFQKAANVLVQRVR
jgi:hypothetical protein